MLNTAQVAARQAQLTTQTFTTAPIVFGHNLPALTLQLLVNTDHSDAFAAGFAQPFLSTANADSVDNVQLSLVDATSSFSGSGSSSSTRRRRASASNDEEGMMVLAEVVVTYTATCLEDECDALVVTEASLKYPALRDAGCGQCCGGVSRPKAWVRTSAKMTLFRRSGAKIKGGSGGLVKVCIRGVPTPRQLRPRLQFENHQEATRTYVKCSLWFISSRIENLLPRYELSSDRRLLFEMHIIIAAPLCPLSKIKERSF